MGFGQRSVSRIDLKRKKTAEGVKRSEGVTICVGYENKKIDERRKGTTTKGDGDGDGVDEGGWVGKEE